MSLKRMTMAPFLYVWRPAVWLPASTCKSPTRQDFLQQADVSRPVRRVILHSARMGREFVGPALLRQMRGRAGRQGKAPIGETYLCCRENELEQVVDLMHADLPEVASCLTTENRRVQRFVTNIPDKSNADEKTEHCSK